MDLKSKSHPSLAKYSPSGPMAMDLRFPEIKESDTSEPLFEWYEIAYKFE